ncbi:hypothetical protein B0H12DRAFT_1092650 [Mycena haematopus]|nr:hypothetical protein B0H12DRAFT_1092650 [Mycena haematopus]
MHWLTTVRRNDHFGRSPSTSAHTCVFGRARTFIAAASETKRRFLALSARDGRSFRSVPFPFQFLALRVMKATIRDVVLLGTLPSIYIIRSKLDYASWIAGKASFHPWIYGIAQHDICSMPCVQPFLLSRLSM